MKKIFVRQHRLVSITCGFAVVLCAALFPKLSFAQADALMTKRATELRDGPSDAAKSLIGLPAQTALTRQTERSGPWIQVRTSTGAIGWVHMFDLGSANATSSGGGNVASGFLRGVTGLFNRGGTQQNTTVATSTVGIRGLEAQDLSNAQPDINRVGQMETFQVDANSARQFASAAGLEQREVPALEAQNLLGGTTARPGGSVGREAP